MTRVLAALFLCLLLLLPGLARAFDPPGLSADAQRYAASIRAKAPPQPNPKAIAEALKQGEAALAKKEGAKAVAAFEKAILEGDNRPAVWLQLSDAWTLGGQNEPKRALEAAFLAYQSAGSQDDAAQAVARTAALTRAGGLLDDLLTQPRLALDAFEEAARLSKDDAGLRQRVTALRQRVGMMLTGVRVDPESDPPRVCLKLDRRLKRDGKLRYQDFVRVEPAEPVAISVSENEVCLAGVQHGHSYQVTLRQGLPSDDGLVLKQDETQTVRVGDREPWLAMRDGGGFILTRDAEGGLPVTTVNLEAVAVTVYRVNDRNLVSQMTRQALLQPIYEYESERLADTDGEQVWQGRLEVRGERNRPVTTGLAIRQIVPEPKPGLYVVTVEPADQPEERDDGEKVTQWLMISDLGLTSTVGADGVTVFARSFASAKPLAGVEVRLIARNNADLGHAVTDAVGRVTFPPGLARGTGGGAPVAVMAYGADGDFAMQDLTATAFDLSDRGVGGRLPPGPMDAFLYSERGVYRPGETVNLAGLLRDEATAAVGGFPVTLKVMRPGGTEFRSLTATTSPAGGFTWPVTLTRTAPLGGWRVEAYTDPKGEPVGRLSFQVEEFVPERLAVTIEPSSPILTPDQPFEAVTTSRFLYGPAAAGLDGTAEMSVGLDPDPYPAFRGYRFGLIQESLTPRQVELSFPTTDDAGVSRVPVSLGEMPDTTRPLRADIRVAVAEPGGRPSRQSLSVPVRTRYAIGIRSRLDGTRLDDGQAPAFDVIAVAPDGSRVARPGLRFQLIAEKTDFYWYREGGRYSFRTATREEVVREGTLDVGIADPAPQTFAPLPAGRYRFEVADAHAGVASSVRFAAGWQVLPEASDVPDEVEVVADRKVYAPGDTARVRINPPFAGEVLVTVATDRLWTARTLTVPKEGAEIEIPVDHAWGPGAYVTATVYRPPVKGQDRAPVRAIGLAWLGVDPAPRSLTVALAAPAVARPGGSVEVAVTVAAAGGAAPLDGATLTLAAVDEGILQLTDFTSPDPSRHFFAKRLLGLDIRDDYGRLLTTIPDVGTLRAGGDGGGGGLAVMPFTTVSLFSGPVAVAADGTARVTFDLPDFNGELRLMAVAWDRTRVGAAGSPMMVRAPLVAELATPRFLAPGDDSQLTLSLHTVEAPAGAYQVTVTTEGPLAIENGVFTTDLAAGERRGLVLPLTGTAAGIGTINVTVAGPGGISVDRRVSLQVRPSRAMATVFEVQRLEPGAVAETGAAVLGPYVPGTASLSVSLSSAPPFNVAGLLRALDRYPYGCVEQITSRALPLLAVNDVTLALGPDRAMDDNLEARIGRAVGQVLDLQRYDGSFGTWSAYSPTDPWLTAYAMEFLVRARAKGHPVPEAPLVAGLSWLRQQAIAGGTEAPELASRAYALHVLALAGIPVPGPARYLHDAFLDEMPTPLARAQLGAALARMGDQERARAAVAAAVDRLARDPWPVDYGSTVRDAAAIVTLVSDTGILTDRLPALLARLPAGDVAVERTSTQEQAWLVLAAHSLMKAAAPLSLSVGNRPAPKGDPVHLIPSAAELSQGLAVRNTGSGVVWRAVSVQGVPIQAPPARHEGLRIKRKFFHRDGTPLNLDTLRQNDVFVIVLEGEATTKLFHQAIAVHPLPAGWEIENPHLGGDGAETLPWLGALSSPRMAQARDDRFVAAIDLTAEEPKFRLAFLVRAVTPGVYELPGAVLEDMYKPFFASRQDAGRITVHPPE